MSTIVESTEAVLSQLAAEVEVPVSTGLQAQGDVMLIPANDKVTPATERIPVAGVPLVRGQGGHVHLLLGDVNWKSTGDEFAQTLGVLTVPEGSVGYLAHGDGTPASALTRDADHGLIVAGPGTYVIRRQREQADVIALVAD